MYDFAHFWELYDLPDLLCTHIIEVLPRELLLLLDLPEYFLRDAMILPQRSHGAPLSSLHHFARVEQGLGHLCPATLDAYVEEATEYSPCTLSNVYHVGIQVIPLELEAGNVCLQEDVDLG